MSTTPPIDLEALRVCTLRPEEARTLPADAYTSPEVFAWETERFLQASWVCLGRSSDMVEPGSQRAVRIGDEAVLLVRGRDGVLRGFFNTCRHRGHELLPCGGPVTTRKAIRCPYHSWVYRLDGSFRAAPGFEDGPGWRTDEPGNALLTARVDEWGGWVFVNASGDAPPLREHLGNLVEAMEPYEQERLVVADRHEYTIEANWKLIAENYHECYHCSTIHPELCQVTPPDSGDAFEPTGLVMGGTMDLMDHAETMSLSGRSEGVFFPSLDEGMRRKVLYVQVFPTMLVSAHPDYVMVHRLEPLDERRTHIECLWLFPPEATEREGFDPSYAVEFWDVTNRQDWAACEGVQRGAAGRGYRQGPLSWMEGNVWQHISLVARGYLEGRVRGPVPEWQVSRTG